MEVYTPNSVILCCIVEEQVFYYGLINESCHVIQSDGFVIDDKHSMFQTPQVIINFLKRSVDMSSIRSTKIAVVNTNFSLIPDIIPDKDTTNWLTHQYNNTQHYHIDQHLNLKIGYHVSAELDNVLHDNLPHPKLHHIMTTNLAGKSKRDGVYSYPINGFQFMQVVDNFKTSYGNLKASHSALSRLYFSLLPYHIHQKDTMSIPLYTTQVKSKNLNDINNYVNDVFVIRPDVTVDSDSPLSHEQVYQLDKLAACAS